MKGMAPGTIINRKDGEKFGARFIELHQKAEKVLNSTNSKGETNSEAALRKYNEWEEKMEQTELPDIFKETQYADFQTFFDSLQNKSRLTGEWLSSNAERFMKWLRV